MSFRGNFEHTIDDKGRVSVPARFRDLIVATNDDRVLVTNFELNSVPHLHVYPYAAWMELEGKIKNKPQFDPAVQHFTNFYLGRAQDCQLDKQGRILLPPNLRAFANLERAVMITGAGEKFNVWNRDAWEQVFSASRTALFADPKMLTDLGI